MTQVSESRTQLIERLLQRRMAGNGPEEVRTIAAGTRIALSSAQARIWFFTRRYPASAEYNVFEALSFPTAPSRAALTGAIATLMARYDALRVRTLEQDGEPVQETVEGLAPPVAWHDLTGLDPATADLRARSIVDTAAGDPIAPDEAPLFRIVACVLPGGGALIALGFHHLILDHWSAVRLIGELRSLLAGHPIGPAGPGFLDYLAALPQPSARRTRAELDYWTTRLGGELPVLDLPRDRPRGSAESRSGRLSSFTVPAGLTARIRAVARAESVSMYVLLLAAYQVFLARLTGRRDVVVGSPLAGRDDAAGEDVLGCFVKPVALRTRVDAGLSFRALLRRVQESVLEAQDNQSVPYEQIVSALGVPRTPGVNPVFQTIFGVQDAIVEEDAADGVSMVKLHSRSARADLTVSVSESARHLDGVMEYASDLFDEATVAGFAAMYQHVLVQLVDEPDRDVDATELIGADERDRLTGGLHPYRKPGFGYRTLAAPFEEQVARTPDRPAVVSDDETLTYAELNERANRLARHLAGRGAGPGTSVGLCLQRGIALVVAVYAVAKTGAAYMPMEPDLPAGRLAFMLADTAPVLVLADEEGAAHLPAAGPALVRIDQPHPWAGLSGADLTVEPPAGSLAYQLYTSGSTGRPKAVAYPIDGALANIFWFHSRYPYTSDDAALLKTSYGFDVSTWELFWPLYHGARLVVARPGGHRDPEYLARLVEQHGIGIVFFVPTMLKAFLDALAPGGCRSLRWVLCGGEAVRPQLRDQCHEQLPGAEMVNVCGPTETGTVLEMVVPREPGAAVVPLGRPCDNFTIYVLGDDFEVRPLGAPGELFIGGEVGLAHGYHGRPALTAERFVPDPFGPPGSRMYASGDLCRFRPDGVIEHLGRIGRQVKIRGLRVELGEIEAVLTEHPAVRDCVVLAPASFDGRIAAFVVTGPDTAGVEPAELQRHARHLLPSHMVPAAVVTVPSVPYTINGKVDEQSLLDALEPAAAGPAAAGVAPDGELEHDLAGIFAAVLGLSTIGVTDGFFDLGGHSLLVFKLIAACGKQLGVRPTVTDVFEAPSVRELAVRLSSGGSGADGPLVPLAVTGGRPLVALVHGGGGSVLGFRELAARLGEHYDVYGLQAPPAEVTSVTVEELAARYADAVDAVRGPRPVIPVGWSIGGCVAVEMSRRWQGTDAQPPATVLLDTLLPPRAAATPQQRDALAQAVRQMDLMGGTPVADAEADGIGADLARLGSVVERHREAFLRYAPQHFGGDITLLQASEPVAGGPTSDDSAATGWRGLAASVAVGHIPGDHFSLIAPRHADALGAAITGVIEDSLSFTEI